jgi:hypothetical protein
MTDMTPCSGCGALFPSIEGPTHRYLESSPGCWAAYGEVLAREYSDPKYMAVHRLTVDTYSVQHPGRPSPQTTQSVAVHLIGLYATLQLQLRPRMVTAAIRRAADHQRFHWLPPPLHLGEFTVADVLPAQSPEQHANVVLRWAASAWAAWSHYHSQVKAWALAGGLK